MVNIGSDYVYISNASRVPKPDRAPIRIVPRPVDRSADAKRLRIPTVRTPGPQELQVLLQAFAPKPLQQFLEILSSAFAGHQQHVVGVHHDQVLNAEQGDEAGTRP